MGMLFLASVTAIPVTRPSNDGNALSCVGSRCCITTNAMPGFAGSFLNNSVIASSPPADAPMAMMGNGFLSACVLAALRDFFFPSSPCAAPCISST